MQKNSIILIQLLSAAISGKSPILPELAPDWPVIYEEALAHQVHTLLFPVIEKLPAELKPEPALLSSWKKDMLREGTFQIQHVEQMVRVFQYFKEQGIPLIALKGLILRNYYPVKELRIMGDADVLIRYEDLKRAHVALVKLGYKKGEFSERHIVYTLEGFPDIELHTLLTENSDMESKADFTSHVWDNTCTELLDTFPVLSLSVKDQILHQLFHIVHHICSGGIGLRQLCDFTLFTAFHAKDIIWEIIFSELELYGYDKFTRTLLAICQDLFDLPLPDELFPVDEEQALYYRNKLEEDILEAGTFGKRTDERAASRNILRYIKGGKRTTIFNLIRFLFPIPAQLRYRYRYAKKYPFLLPIAWRHRGVYNLRQLSLLAFIWNKESSTAYSDRIQLLTWLELR